MNRRLPLWLTVAATVCAASIPAGIAWGLGQGRLDALERRVDTRETQGDRIDDRLRAIEAKVERALALLEASR